MPPKKTLRNARIVRLRDWDVPEHWVGNRNGITMSWQKIADRIAIEFPEDAVSRQRCWEIYQEETK
jgi:hypothetical protein